MAAEAPVMAFGAAAVPETLDGSGVVFTEKHFAFLAELANDLIAPSTLRKAVLRAQQRRVRAFSAERALQALQSALPPTRINVKKSQRRRVAIVIQRYGDVIGGAELLARWVAQRLSSGWDITVLTTCAKDHLSWANEFPAGASRDGRVRVIRFPCERPRDLPSFNALSDQLYARPTDYTEEERWVAEQGPLVPELMRYLDERQRDFAAFIFFTYLYASTVWGLPLVGKRALLVPTAHDEPPLHFGLYREVFSVPSALLCSTLEEEALIHQRFPQHARTRLAGVGIDARPGIPSRFRKRFHLPSPYLMYVGRIEAGKGIRELVHCYAALRRELPDPPELVFGGSGRTTIDEPGVRCLGPITEQEKLDGLAGAAVAVVPSRYESLSLLALEAFSQGTPVLANGESEVLAGHIERSGAGVTYLDPASFIEGFRKASAERESLGRRGLRYARRHSWKRVLEVYEQELGRIQREIR
jgi:glycosyltransferase involved in cell wall biosynthesis